MPRMCLIHAYLHQVLTQKDHCCREPEIEIDRQRMRRKRIQEGSEVQTGSVDGEESGPSGLNADENEKVLSKRQKLQTARGWSLVENDGSVSNHCEKEMLPSLVRSLNE
jgi:hypothetical protein